MPILPSGLVWDVQTIGIWVAALLTVAVLSAAIGENSASRAVFALLVGVAAGYAAVLTWQGVLWPRIMLVAHDPVGRWPLLIWFGLGVLLLARGTVQASWLSSLSLAHLVGVGVALAIGGAALGTALPQVAAVWAERSQVGPGAWWPVGNALLIAVGTAGVLFRFTYTGQGAKNPIARAWNGLAHAWGKVGYGYLLVALGALFATAIVSLLALLTARLEFLLFDWLRLAVR